MELCDVLSAAGVPADTLDDALAVGGVRVEVADLRERRHPTLKDLTEDVSSRGLSLLVADRITANERISLVERGWSWYDRRGHLRLVAPGVFVDADVPSRIPAGTVTSPWSNVGVEVALEILSDPATRASPRALGRRLDRDPTFVGKLLSRLRGAGLITHNNAVGIPELFWDLASHWPRSDDWVPLVSSPADIDGLLDGLGQKMRIAEWIKTGDRALADWGAPVAGYNIDMFYVPDAAAVSRAVRSCGQAVNPDQAAVWVRPKPARNIDGVEVEGSPWLQARPVVCALEVANDSRMAEGVRAWNPDPETGISRVW